MDGAHLAPDGFCGRQQEMLHQIATSYYCIVITIGVIAYSKKIRLWLHNITFSVPHERASNSIPK